MSFVPNQLACCNLSCSIVETDGEHYVDSIVGWFTQVFQLFVDDYMRSGNVVDEKQLVHLLLDERGVIGDVLPGRLVCVHVSFRFRNHQCH